MGSDWTARNRTGLAMSAGLVDWRRAETALLAVKRLSRGGMMSVVRIGPCVIIETRRSRSISLFWEVCGEQISGLA